MNGVQDHLRIFIGTSGWSYKHWEGNFYPPGLSSRERLSYYARHFDTVEINHTFYRLPKEATFRNWRQQVPPHFLFAVKANRYLTHFRKLKGVERALSGMLRKFELLGENLGPVLFQLPPRWHYPRGRFQEFLRILPPKFRFAIELRDPSWMNREVYDLLHRCELAHCLHDFHSQRSEEVVTTDWVYIRFHGPRGDYTGSYSEGQLAEWVDKFAGWKKRGVQVVYVYFNNDQRGFAVENARTLRELCATRGEFFVRPLRGENI